MEKAGAEKRIRFSGVLIASAWTLVVAVSLVIGIQNEYRVAETQATKVARSHLDKDQAFRQWVSARGGLYAPISELTQPNPYMAHVDSQDVKTPVGDMTLLNPAYILRLLMDEYGTLYGIKGRIVGLKALNPSNLADPWESRVIDLFERDRSLKEFAEVTDLDGKGHLRMMVPMFMNESCLKCHAHLGYKVGDLRGGVNVAVPLHDFYAVAHAAAWNLALTHGLIGALGLFGIGFVTTRTLKYTRRRERDIDELRLAAHVFDDSLQGIMITDGKGVIQRVNRRFSEITGFSAAEALGSKPSIMKSGRQDRAFYKALWGAIHGPGVWQGELVNRKRNGDEFHVWESIVTLFDDDGKPRNFIALFEDITLRKLAELETRRLNEELEQRVAERTLALVEARDESERANKAKSGFLSQMSHELRTPLNAILGFTQLLLGNPKEPVTPAQREDVGQIMRAGTHLLDMINDILDIARVESGRAALSIVPTEVGPLLSQSAALIRSGRRGAAAEVAIDNGIVAGGRVMGDPKRLRQVLLNLLSNAVKFNRPGGSVQLRAHHSPHAGGHGRVRLEVRDNGPGMSEEEMARLFVPFERLARHAHIQGTGIGLALSKTLVESMGGSIGATINASGGMTFWLELPAAEPAATPFEATERAYTPLIRAATSSAARVLYIEDNPANMALVARFMAARGSTLIEAELPGKGLALAEEMRPDLILLDIQMPGMDGFEVLAELKRRESTRDIPVIAVSANAMPEDIERARQAGFVDYMTKPLDLELFGSTLDNILMSQRKPA